MIILKKYTVIKNVYIIFIMNCSQIWNYKNKFKKLPFIGDGGGGGKSVAGTSEGLRGLCSGLFIDTASREGPGKVSYAGSLRAGVGFGVSTGSGAGGGYNFFVFTDGSSSVWFT